MSALERLRMRLEHKSENGNRDTSPSTLDLTGGKPQEKTAHIKVSTAFPGDMKENAGDMRDNTGYTEDIRENTGCTGNIRENTGCTGDMRENTGCTGDIQENTGDNTTDTTDHTSMMQKINQLGNRAEDWLEYTNYMRNIVTYSSDKIYTTYLFSLYSRAVRAIDMDMHRESVAYAQLLISCAYFKKTLSVTDARSFLQFARNTVKKLAIVYIASAQLELELGNANKCKRFLEKGIEKKAEPEELLKVALQNFKDGEVHLIAEHIMLGTGNKENQGEVNKLENTRLLATSTCSNTSTITTIPGQSYTCTNSEAKKSFYTDTMTRSDSQSRVESTTRSAQRLLSDSTEEGFRMPCMSVSQSVKSTSSVTYSRIRVSDSQPRANTSCLSTPQWKPNSVSPKEGSGSTSDTGGDSTVDFLHGNPGTVRPESADTSDNNDTIPVSFDADKGVYKRSMRSYTSTPDCKTPGILRYSNRKPKNLGKPMRVKRTSLPQLREGMANDDDDDDIRLYPLPETVIFNDAKEGEEIHKKLEESLANSNLRKDDAMENEEEIADPPQLSFVEPKNAVEQPMYDYDSSKHDSSDSGVLSNLSEERPGASLADQAVVDKTTGSTASTLKATSVSASVPASVSTQMLPQFVQAVVPATPMMVMAPPSMPLVQMMPAQGLLPTQVVLPAGYIPTPNRQTEVITVHGKMYTVLRMLGRGGSSKVYDTFDQSFMLRAVKCVNLEGADQATIESYRNEIQLLKRLQHSNRVVKLYDYEYVEAHNVLYVVMERGDTDLVSLFGQFAKSGGIDSVMQKFYWKEMLKAVHVLHQEGIVHSDLKPANFLLVAGNLKLIDFGISKALQHDKTSITTDQQVGTLNYMSPEAILDTCGGASICKPKFRIGVKSDVWSLGCILYNLVYGKTPFHHIANNLLKLQAITNPNVVIDFPPVDSKLKDLREILMKCLRRDPKERPTIAELLDYDY